MRLRTAKAQDAQAVSACVEAAYQRYVERIGKPPAPMIADYATLIREHRVTVAESGGKVIGVLVVGTMQGRFLLENVAVEPAHQGHGTGRRLVAHAEARAHRDGFAFVHLYTNEKMTENLAWYEKLGYVEFDRRTEQGFARIYMRKALK